jgi:hypothetical protein
LSRQVPDKPLSGHELKTVIKRDVDNILDQDGMLANHIAFKRVSYEVIIKLHLDNPFYPEHASVITSHPATAQEITKSPDSGLEAVEAFPLKNPTDDTIKKGTKRTRTIVSNNLARVEHEIPALVQVRTSDGSIENKEIKYTMDDFAEGYIEDNKPKDHGFEDADVEA